MAISVIKHNTTSTIQSRIRRINQDLIHIYKILYGYIKLDCSKYDDFRLNFNPARSNYKNLNGKTKLGAHHFLFRAIN